MCVCAYAYVCVRMCARARVSACVKVYFPTTLRIDVTVAGFAYPRGCLPHGGRWPPDLSWLRSGGGHCEPPALSQSVQCVASKLLSYSTEHIAVKLDIVLCIVHRKAPEQMFFFIVISCVHHQGTYAQWRYSTAMCHMVKWIGGYSRIYSLTLK